ncbi:MAG: hypothetical protein Q7K25_04995 [Actinomycetota bacterium]|nr:hypothetical protein [Actinomycetota bacterium]
MNSWQSATTAVEPGHHAPRAVEADDPDLAVPLQVAVVPAVASPRVVHEGPVLQVAASQEGRRIDLVHQPRVQDPQTDVMTEGATSVRVPTINDQPADAIAVGWTLDPKVTVRAVRRLAVDPRIVAMIVRAVRHHDPRTPIVARVVVVTTVVVMIVPVPVLRARVVVVTTVGVKIVPARTMPIVARVVVVTTVVVMIVRVHQLRVPKIVMTVVVIHAQEAIVLAVQRRVVVLRIDVMIALAALHLVPATPIAVNPAVVMSGLAPAIPIVPTLVVAMTQAVMIVLVRLHLARAALARLAIEMSDPVRRLRGRDIPIAVMSVVMVGPPVHRIAQQLAVRAIRVKSAMIAEAARRYVVAMMAIRFAIREFQMTSHPRILTAGS